MKKQNLEDIFSALDNYATPPPPDLWDGIEAQLDEPKRKKSTVFWWPVAASLVLGLSLGGMLLFSKDGDSLSVPNKNSKNNVVIENVNPTTDTKQDPFVIQSNATAVALENKEEENTSKNKNSVIKFRSKKESVQLQNVINSISQKSENNYLLEENTAIVGSTEKQNAMATNSNTSDLKKLAKNQIDYQKSSINFNANQEEMLGQSTKEVDQFATNLKKQQIAQNEAETKATVANELLQLEKELAKTDESDDESNLIDKSIPTDRWSVGIYAGIAASENYSNKKVLGADVSSKQTSGFGVKTNYKVSKKWAVSAGLKVNELGQSLANVSYYNKQAGLPMGLASNDFFTVNENVAYLSSNPSYVFAADNTENAKSNSTTTATVDQNLQYIEMPLEISYSVFDSKKTNIRFNTGGFMGKLISNEVTLDGSAIGENLNVNDFVYGSKLSSTIQYEVFKKTQVFVEPAMNYYINPIKNESFNQFQWGLNFGINVNF